MIDKPFDTIESALEFLALFEAAIAETIQDVQNDMSNQAPDTRHSDALRLTVYKLEKLEHHITRSKRITNDLRTLRRLLFQERQSARSAETQVATTAAR